MILLLAALAHAAPPPHVDLEQLDRWEARTRAAVSGPADACWVLSGDAMAKVGLHQAPTFFSRASSSTMQQTGTFIGTLDRGRWTSLDFDLQGDEEVAEDEILMRPLVGVRKPREPKPAPATAEPDQGSLSIGIQNGDVDIKAAGSQASATLARLVSGAFSDLPTISFVQWDEASQEVQLTVETPLDEDHPNDLVTTTARFAGGGNTPTAIDIVLPKRVTLGDGLVRAKLIGGQLHVRGVDVRGQMLPTVESVSGVLGVLGFTISYEQRLIYRQARPCPSSAPPP